MFLLQSRTLPAEDVTRRVQELMATGKSIVCAGTFTTLPLPPHVEEHFHNPNYEYLWGAWTITKETMPSMPDEAIEKAKGLHIGLWLTNNIKHIQYVLVNDIVLNHILAMKSYPEP